MKSAFASCHPIINFTFFCSVIISSMFFLHPVFLCISLVTSFAYSIYLNGKKALKFNLLFLLPSMLIIILMNPLFNHAGVTILFYLRNNPVTLESIVYGGVMAMTLVSVILWFSCYNVIMTSDKFIYLFGRIIPSLSLILSMVLRFVPKFKAQIKVISNAQKCVGRDISNGTPFEKARHGIKIISIMVTWALENSIETADSMRSRGYGLKGRTSFSIFRFDARDRAVLSIMILFIGIILAGAVLGQNSIQYFPSIKAGDLTGFSFLVYLSYLLLCCSPMLLELKEDLKWRHLQSRI